ncbi:MAG: hypothetical protein K5681_10820 [Treponema sp.]|nr:hypothetical protein [Treponema sp.]
MKSNKSLVKIILGITILILLALILFLGLKSSQKVKIAFYNVSEKSQNAIVSQLKKNVKTLQLDSSKSLSEQKALLRNCSLIVFSDNIEAKMLLEGNQKEKGLAKELDLSFLEGFPSSIQNSLLIRTNKKGKEYIKLLPILYDFYEIDVNRDFYQQSGMEAINTWEDLIETAYREKDFTKSAMLIPLSKDSDFLNSMGIISEALCGYQAYNQMLEDFSAIQYGQYGKTKDRKEEIQKALEKYSAKDQCLKITAKELEGLLRSGIVSKDSLQLSTQDILFLMDNDLCGIAFTSLSDHRKLSKDTSKHITSIYCPSKDFTPERSFASQSISISLLKDNKKSKEIIKKLSADNQNTLSTLSGLAPVQKNCAVADHQADDVRFWLAASKGPVMPFANVFSSDSERKLAADFLRDLISLEAK